MPAGAFVFSARAPCSPQSPGGVSTNMATLQDRVIKCVDCGEDFTFTVGEQEFYRDHGLTNTPTRCKRCRENRKGQRSGGGGRAEGGHGGRRAARPGFPAVGRERGARRRGA